uniref:Retrotrans_gag domain-containing protein n=1 Tax=Heterorhabditis bacteriophora TaxID=37862 RepID=A0A1I7X4P9_HETBA
MQETLTSIRNQYDRYRPWVMTRITTSQARREDDRPKGDRKMATIVALPEITLSTFDRNATEWKRFYQLFSSTIDTNQSLPDIAKLNYLITSFQGFTSQCVDWFDITAENYRLVLNRLK